MQNLEVLFRDKLAKFRDVILMKILLLFFLSAILVVSANVSANISANVVSLVIRARTLLSNHKLDCQGIGRTAVRIDMPSEEKSKFKV